MADGPAPASPAATRPPIVVRPAARSDREFVLSLAPRLAAFDPPAWRTADEIADGDRRALQGWFDDPKPHESMLVAEIDGQPVGCAYLVMLTDYFNSRAHAHLSVLAVAREAEGKGVGSALLTASEQWARGRGSDRLTLSVFAANERARGVYERHGFGVEILRYAKPL